MELVLLPAKKIAQRHAGRMFLTCSFAIFFALADRTTPRSFWLFVFAMAFCGGVLVWQALMLLRDTSTTITAEGVRQRRWSRSEYLAWDAVRSIGVSVSFKSLHLQSECCTVVISPLLFENWDAAVDAVQTAVPPQTTARLIVP
jgi:hypothetical protein